MDCSLLLKEESTNMFWVSNCKLHLHLGNWGLLYCKHKSVFTTYVHVIKKVNIMTFQNLQTYIYLSSLNIFFFIQEVKLLAGSVWTGVPATTGALAKTGGPAWAGYSAALLSTGSLRYFCSWTCRRPCRIEAQNHPQNLAPVDHCFYTRNWDVTGFGPKIHP